MEDTLGTYYYPYPQNKKLRMYVRIKQGEIEFRMRNDDDPKMWTEHGWIPQEAVAQAQVLYRSNCGFDPGYAYNTQLAKTLLKK